MRNRVAPPFRGWKSVGGGKSGDGKNDRCWVWWRERVEEEKRKRASFLWVEKAVEETDGREEGMEIKAYFPFEHQIQIHITMYISSVQPRGGQYGFF